MILRLNEDLFLFWQSLELTQNSLKMVFANHHAPMLLPTF